jgi:hypothetical protein
VPGGGEQGSLMPNSEQIDLLSKALVGAQGEFTAVPRGSENPFFHSSYADLATVVQAASPVLAKHGLAVSQFPSREDGAPVLVTYLLHESGQYISHSMPLTPTKSDPQAVGSAITYARRYAFSAVLGLVTEADDDGNAASQRQPQSTATLKKRSPSKLDDAKAKLRTAIAQAGVDGKDFAWVAKATEADIDQIEGAVAALSMGKAV